MRILLFLSCFLYQQRFAASAPFILDDYRWYSGLIDGKYAVTVPEIHHQSTPQVQPLQSLFGSLSSLFSSDPEVPGPDKEAAYNFLLAKLPIIKKVLNFERILFVSPQILEKDSEAVQETLAQLYCGLLGILLKDQDISKMKMGIFFARLPAEARQMLKRCLEEFENRAKMKLQVAMIDAGSDSLPSGFVEEFRQRKISLYRHPLKMVHNEVFYLRDDFKEEEAAEDDEVVEEWAKCLRKEGPERTDLRHRRIRPFRVLQSYAPVISKEQLEIEEAKRETERRIAGEDFEEYMKQLEPIFGRFDEVDLEDEKCDEKGEDEWEKVGDEDEYEDGYEFIQMEDYEPKH